MKFILLFLFIYFARGNHCGNTCHMTSLSRLVEGEFHKTGLENF